MRHLASFVELTRRLARGKPCSGSHVIPADDYRLLDRLTNGLLELARELRAEMPDPWRFLARIGETAVEAAILASPWDPPETAVGRLARLQRERLARRSGAGSSLWQRRPAHAHLASAFWQLAGICQEVYFGSDDEGPDGQLEEHAADFANYLMFTALASGAWDLTLGGGLLPPELARHVRPAPSTPPSDFPAPEFPGAGLRKGGRR